MLLTGSLFALWMLLNVLDVALGFLGAQFGASEIGFLYSISGSWERLTINKMVFALLIGGVLVYFKKNTLLAVLSVGIASLCAYQIIVVLLQAGVK